MELNKYISKYAKYYNNVSPNTKVKIDNKKNIYTLSIADNVCLYSENPEEIHQIASKVVLDRKKEYETQYPLNKYRIDFTSGFLADEIYIWCKPYIFWSFYDDEFIVTTITIEKIPHAFITNIKV